jgi:hypothetical protein
MENTIKEERHNTGMRDESPGAGQIDDLSVLQQLEDGQISVETAIGILEGMSDPTRIHDHNTEVTRMNILERLERGEMDTEEALAFFNNTVEEDPAPDRHMHVLHQIENGHLTPDEAVRLLDGSVHPVNGESTRTEPDDEDEAATATRKSLRKKARWGLFGVSLVLSALGGWLAALGGWWWLGAVPLLLTGLPLLVLVIVSWQAVWLYVNIDTREEWPRKIVFCFPLPLRLAGWVIRNFGSSMDALKGTAVDELLMELEHSIQNNRPIAIDIDETDSGERVQVYLG